MKTPIQNLPNLARLVVLVWLSTFAPRLSTLAQGTAFTYQGRLTDGPNAASGIYDLRFTIYDSPSGGAVVAGPVTNSAVAVSNGLFTVTLDFGVGVFTGAERWLFLAVRTNGAVSFTPLTPPQQITATPYAITAGHLSGPLSGTSLSGPYPNAVTLNNPANSFSGNGSNLTALNTSQLASGTVPAAALGNAWRIGGNAGATAGANFVGTTDTNALEFKVSNQRALRLEPTTNPDTVNVIGGSARNSTGAGTVGATIGGGGSGDYFGAIYTNRVEGDFGTVAGGALNTIQFIANYATIGGGALNKIQTNAAFASIGGGSRNTIQTNATYATLGGGDLNVIRMNASYATLGGGTLNEIGLGAVLATIDGGSANVIGQDSSYTTIGGGSQNTIQRGSSNGTIGGGHGNRIQDSIAYSTIGGGYFNTIQNSANDATIGGGSQNTVQASAHWATIGGGSRNTNWTLARVATIGGGGQNTVQADYATIPGGLLNSAGNYAFAAGRRAKATHAGSFVWADSTDADFNSTAAKQFLIRAGGNVGINKTNPATTLDVNGTVTATGFSGNGAGLTNVTALTVGGLSSSNLWTTTGNAGANPATGAFLGTTDDQPVDFKVNGMRALRLEPNVNAPNVIGGSGGNHVAPGLFGATIGGGGLANHTNKVEVSLGTIAGGSANTVRAGGGFIGAGWGNLIDYNLYDGVISGGNGNRIEPGAHYATIPGGFHNNAAGVFSFAAGRQAKANHPGAFVWADSQDADFASTRSNQFLIRATGNVGINKANPATALDVNGTVTATGFSGNGAGLTNLTAVTLGGLSSSNLWITTGNAGANPANGAFLGTTDLQPLEFKVNNRRALRLEPGGSNSVNVIGGWMGNGVTLGVVGAIVAGGGAGDYFGISYTNRVDADFGTVSGGMGNTIQAGSRGATIGGGSANTNVAISATIGGGDHNTIEFSAGAATIGGGYHNTIEYSAGAATIGGGDQNTIQPHALWATIGGGYQNTNQSFAAGATIGGGIRNTILNNAIQATIGGGYQNTIQPNAQWATIPGGFGNSATNQAFAAGRRAKAIHTGAFVWADSTDLDFASTATDQFSIRASGGVRFASGAGGRETMTILNNGFVGINTWPGVPDAFLTVNGSASKPGGGPWSVSSDERLKKNIRPLTGVLEKLLALRGVSYEYKEPEKIHELSGERTGLIAQEVEKVFPDWVETGANGYKRLTVRGFEALTVEALRELRAEKNAQISALEKQNAAQQAIHARMEARLIELEKAVAILTEKPSRCLAASVEGAAER